MEIAAPAPIDDDGSVDGMVHAVPGEGHDRSASEVSEDESDVEMGNPTSPDGSPLVIARKDDSGVVDDGDDDDMEALGNLNYDPHSVGSIFSRRQQLNGYQASTSRHACGAPPRNSLATALPHTS